MTKRILATCAAIVAIATPVLASDYRATNRMQVTDTGNGTFQVSGRPKLGARSYWCAAGEYALARLGLGKTQPLYVAQAQVGAEGPVTFTASSVGLEPKRYLSISQSVKNAGGKVSVGQAQAYCRDRDELYFERP